jgi:cell division protein FtsB
MNLQHLQHHKIRIIIGVLLLGILFGNAGFRTMVRRYWELGKLEKELDTLRKENLLLKREVYYLEGDSSYIERIARRELGLISPGEIEYRFKK